MNKKYLKNGSVVELRNKERYLVIGSTLLDLDNFGYFINLKNYKSNLLFNGDKEWDIMKINNNVNYLTGMCNDPLREVYLEDEPVWTWMREKEKNVETFFSILPTTDDIKILKRLKAFYPELKYLARDEDGDLSGFFDYPLKSEEGFWYNSQGGCDLDLTNCNQAFKFVMANDDVPWCIDKEVLNEKK